MPAELTVAPSEPRLTRKQEAFALEIASNPRLTQTECARRVGCPDSSAKVSACRWMKMAPVKAEIERLQNEILEREGVSRFSILREVAAVGHSNVLDFEEALKSGDLSKLTRQQAAAIKKVTIEEFEEKPAEGTEQKTTIKRRISLELLPKTPALELLGKNINIWGAGDPDGAAAASNNVQVNVIFDL